MSDVYRKDIDDVLLEFSINGKAKNEDWAEVDIKITSPVISYNLRDWEPDGEIFQLVDIKYVIRLMDRWNNGELMEVEEYEALEPDLLLKFYPGEEKRIDFCICLQTTGFAFTENYIIIPLYNKDATDFVDYWKSVEYEFDF